MTEIISYNKFKCDKCNNEILHTIKPGVSAVFCHYCNEKIKL